MKVLHINSYYYGGEFYKNLYDEQIKSGLDINVFVPIKKRQKNSTFEHGNYTILSENHNEIDRYIFFTKHMKILKDIKEKLDIKKYSIIHAHSLFSNGYIAMKLKLKYGIPYIVTVRNTDVNLFFKKMIHLRGIGQNIIKNADNIIFLSQSYKELVIQKYISKKMKKLVSEKSLIIPNGIDDFWFSNIRLPFVREHKDYLRLLQVGDINKNKNIITTVNVVEYLNLDGIRTKLFVIGKIVDEKVFNAIKDNQHVIYLGYKAKEELLELYRNCDIFILPSVNETFGLVYAEAMSQGLPVIYSRGQGFDKQFEDGLVGFPITPYDNNEIIEKIKKINDNITFYSENALKLVNKFQWSKINSEYMTLYKHIFES